MDKFCSSFLFICLYKLFQIFFWEEGVRVWINTYFFTVYKIFFLLFIKYFFWKALAVLEFIIDD